MTHTKWKQNGITLVGENSYGNLYVSDLKKNEGRQWKRGTVVVGGNGEGDKFNQLNVSLYIYISDSKNDRVMKWMKDAKEGIVVASGNGQENSLIQLSFPKEIILDQFGQIYIGDWDNNRVMCWCSRATEGSIIIGANSQRRKSNKFYNPQDLSFDRQRNIYVVDSKNNEIQKN